MTKRSTKILTRGIDPIVVKLRTEQVRLGLSSYALAKDVSEVSGKMVTAGTLGTLWSGRANPNLDRVRDILTALRKYNPDFTLTDP